MQRVAEPAAVEQIADRPDGPEQGAQPAMVEVAERTRPAACIATSRARSRAMNPPPSGDCTLRRRRPSEPRGSPHAVHSAGRFGDKVRPSPARFVDKAVVPGRRRRLHFSCPKGQVEPPDQTGERSSGGSRGAVQGRKARERGTWAERRRLRTCSEPSASRPAAGPPTVPSGASLSAASGRAARCGRPLGYPRPGDHPDSTGPGLARPGRGLLGHVDRRGPGGQPDLRAAARRT